MQSEVIKVEVVTIDMSSIGIKFENFMQAGCRHSYWSKYVIVILTYLVFIFNPPNLY